MNYDISKDSLSVRKIEFEGCNEIPIDIDFSLPDYCPDIQRVLKCQICPNITSRSISGDRLNIDGNAIIRVIYTDSESMKVRCYENSMPFSSSVDIKCTPQDAFALTNARVEYINCRAVSQRKIDIHGAISVCATVFSKNTQEISSFISGKDIQQKLENIKVSDLIGIGQQQFSVTENLEFDGAKPSPELIIRTNMFLTLNDYKLMPNKILFKGEAILKLLYIDNIETGSTQTVEYTFPVSQIVDIPGIDETSKFVMNGEILGHEEQIISEGLDENSKKSISSEIRIAMTVMAYREKKVKIVSDAYSTEYDLTLMSEPFSLSNLSDNLSDSFSSKFSVKIPEQEVSKIVDVWSDVCSAKLQNKDKLELKGKINLCVLALDAENIPFYVERIVEFINEKPLKDLNLKTEEFNSEINIVPKSIGYTIPKDGKIDVKVNFEIRTALYSNEKYSMVKSVSSEGLKLQDKDCTANLMIYYASDGEKIWDIARKYYTSVNAIKSENDIEEDVIQTDGMILIPLRQ